MCSAVGSSCQARLCCGGAGDACCPGLTCGAGLSCLGAACGSTVTCETTPTPLRYQGSDQTPTAIAVNATAATAATTVFWVDTSWSGFVRSSPVASANPATVESGMSSAYYPSALALSPDFSTLFWADLHYFYECPLGGAICAAAPTQLTATNNSPPPPGTFAVNSTTLYFYPGAGNSGIHSCAWASCTPTPFVALGGIAGMALDSQNLYWTDAIQNSVNSWPLGSPASPGTGTALASGRGTLRGLALDSSHVYWAEDQAIWSANHSGGNQTMLSNGGGCPSAIAVDGAALYWADPCLSAIYKLPLCGSPLQKLWGAGPSGAPDTPVGLTLDSRSVYWTDPNGNLVMSLPK